MLLTTHLLKHFSEKCPPRVRRAYCRIVWRFQELINVYFHRFLLLETLFAGHNPFLSLLDI